MAGRPLRSSPLVRAALPFTREIYGRILMAVVLTARTVVDTGAERASRDGLDAVGMRAVAKDLGRGTQIPDERGHVRILLEESEGAAWQRIHDALDAARDDWHEHLHVNPRPG